MWRRQNQVFVALTSVLIFVSVDTLGSRVKRKGEAIGLTNWSSNYRELQEA